MEQKDIRNAGLKVTLPRMKILEILESNLDHHMSAEEIYKALLDSGDDIGLATVYRVLNQFEAVDLVSKLHFEGGQAVFELSSGEHHDHVVCLDCGHVEEFVDEIIEARQRVAAEKLGFEIDAHSLVLYGHCRKKSCVHKKSISD